MHELARLTADMRLKLKERDGDGFGGVAEGGDDALLLWGEAGEEARDRMNYEG